MDHHAEIERFGQNAAWRMDMPKMRKKADLPTKICATCGLPFAWRKKWEKVWQDVIYCSDRCRTGRRSIRATPRMTAE